MVSKKRLIDVKPLMEDGWHLVKTGKSNEFLASMSLADVPTMDAVEVVRCKDCKECIKYPRSVWFDGFCVLNRVDTLDNDFCSYGERKGNERKAD